MAKKKTQKIIDGLPSYEQIAEIANRLKLSGTKRLILYNFRWRMHDGNKETWPSQKTMSEIVGVSERSIRENVNQLCALNLIRKERRKSNFYRFIYPWEVSEQPEVQSSCLEQEAQSSGLEPEAARREPEVPRKEPEPQLPMKSIEKSNQNSSHQIKGKDEDDNPIENNPQKEICSPKGKDDAVDFPKMGADDFHEMYGTGFVPGEDILAASDVNLSDIVAPLKPLKISKNVTDPVVLDQWNDFKRDVVRRHWNPSAKPPGKAFHALFNKLLYSGAATHLGFNPKSEAQLQAEAEERERMAEIERKRWEAEQKKSEEEASKQRLQDNRLEQFISKAGVSKYLKHMGLFEYGYMPLGKIRDHFRQLKEDHGFETLDGMEQYCTDEYNRIIRQQKEKQGVKVVRRVLLDNLHLIRALHSRGKLDCKDRDDLMISDDAALLEFVREGIEAGFPFEKGPEFTLNHFENMVKSSASDCTQ